MFSRRGAWIDRPVTIACGACRGCRLEKSRQWAVRCLHEASTHQKNSFITLTYDDENLPDGGSLKIEDWQKFAKRLRHTLGKFRFYHCGEYGDLSGRPHYHACIFGINFDEDRKVCGEERGNKLYRSEKLESIWGMGKTIIGEVTFKSAAYVARYIMKKQYGDAAKHHYEYVDQATGEVTIFKPEYSTMSRRPGIGKEWYEKFGKEVYREDFCVINGKKVRPPSYYDALLEKEDLVKREKIRWERIKKGKKREKNNTWERLLVREKYQEERVRQLKRGGTDGG